ncbi:SUMF1/EgtB/PvdO family nonheme iron enzyme [Thalassococcus lentus]|uniref:SUMF1/EgtB/PvdO family nonheme iron enzyme n=1 Tax=Thalassococcus lentus TaxID=1210524 RepID=A0ABT4XTW5_9RHOB|nr:SUMF1/EgtB/PvdO family nonheme iron enzyme [Thalassococcus lentus]MDA7425300.1 SUMF1/EgtB/PvdO family nonheme iron enzyme [Thalassococcus lentus]
MPRIFISHRSTDDDDKAVDILSGWLIEQGHKDHFIDHRDITGGTSWDEALRREASRADLMILYVTSSWLDSEECFAEYRSSFYGNKTVIPLLVDNPQAKDLTGSAKARFETLCASVQGIALSDPLPTGFTAEQIEKAITRVSNAAKVARRQRILARVGLVAAAFLLTVVGLGLAFPSFVADMIAKRQVDRSFATTMQTDQGFLDCDDHSRCPEMVPLPAAQYEIGYVEDFAPNDWEGPPTPVEIPAFAVSMTEITKEQWHACVLSTRQADEGAPRCKELVYSEAFKNEPVETISWHDTQDYIAWLNLRVSGSTEGPYRLLSEAEWEYAARGGVQPRTVFSWGPGMKGACQHANLLNPDMPASLDVRRRGHDCTGQKPENDKLLSEVATYNSNAFGLYDTAGNVSEWVADCWHGSHRDRPDNIGAGPWVSDAPRNCDRVLKGGSWIGDIDLLRPAARVPLAPDVLGYNIGMRVARDLSP